MNIFRKALIIVTAALALAGCGNDKTINNKHYQTFGVANQDVFRDSNIEYEISAGSVIWAIILSETIQAYDHNWSAAGYMAIRDFRELARNQQ